MAHELLPAKNEPTVRHSATTEKPTTGKLIRPLSRIILVKGVREDNNRMSEE